MNNLQTEKFNTKTSESHSLESHLRSSVSLMMASKSPEKPIRSLILDASPIITNTPSISTLQSQTSEILTTHSVVAEIRDSATRLRFDTIYKPFIELRTPKPESLKFAIDFAKKAGDYAVLSRTDLELLALAYEVECEKNGGDWRLRRTPGQKGLNGSPPVKTVEAAGPQSAEDNLGGNEVPKSSDGLDETQENAAEPKEIESNNEDGALEPENKADLSSSLEGVQISQPLANDEAELQAHASPNDAREDSREDEEDSDSEGWITPSNISKYTAKDTGNMPSTTSTAKAPTVLQSALLTSDFALQNTSLQMNLNLLSPQLTRIRNLRSTVLRCHACFFVIKSQDTSKQFCPRCGKPTLTKVTCTTDANTGEFKLHLKKKMQWNTRGDKFTIPKAVAGTANGKVVDGKGGKGGWGTKLILAEDQKEYTRALESNRREKKKDLLDIDTLPDILTGARGGSGGRPKIGAGRNINSTKRR